MVQLLGDHLLGTHLSISHTYF